MNEVALKAVLTVQGAVHQHLLGTLASKGLIDLRSMHRDLTESVTSDLFERAGKTAETEAVANGVLDLLFSQALRIEAELRGGQTDEEA